uniref:Endosome-associated-trafficking regulator 1 n=1 Tax=Mus spicilegus TaxID=10103 RepID=A0A8C6H976_MUSSI
MSSYTRQRRRGVPPLSQTWSRVVPDNFGDKLEDLEKANPFSFKEYLKTKNLSLSNEDMTTSRIYLKEASRHPLGLKHSSPASKPMGYGLEYQQPFCEDPTRARNLEEDEEDGWNRTYLPPAVGQTHSSRATQNSSPCGTYLSFFSNTSELAGPESLPPLKLSNTDSRISPVFPAGIPNADFVAHEDSLGDRHLRTLQMSYEALKDENSNKSHQCTTEIELSGTVLAWYPWIHGFYSEHCK